MDTLEWYGAALQSRWDESERALRTHTHTHVHTLYISINQSINQSCIPSPLLRARLGLIGLIGWRLH